MPSVLLDQMRAQYAPEAPGLTELERSICFEAKEAKLPVAVLNEDQFEGSS